MNEKGMRSISWIFYTFILPIIFSVIILFLIIQFMFGINVTGSVSNWALQFPIVRHAIGLGPLPVPVPVQIKQMRSKMQADAQQIARLQQEVATLQSQVSQANQQASTTETRLSIVKKQLHALQKLHQSAVVSAAIYSNMTPDQAALIISQLPFAQEVIALRAMDPGTQASILGKMSAAKAAKLLQAGA